VAVGDRVQVLVSNPSSGIVEGIAERKNSLARVAPGKEGTEIQHVLAANVDSLAIVVSLTQPELSPGLVDRYWIAALSAGIPTLLCVTKIDLGITPEAKAVLEMYESLGLPIRKLSSKTGAGIDELRLELSAKTVVFSGQSGVGKTSLLRKLLNREIGKVGDISEITGKGKHTTSSAVMITGPEGAHWIDTPGVREFGLQGVQPETLKNFYPEMQKLKCTANSCSHLSEQECEARSLLRYASYKRIYESLLAGEN
jgi:ribosome biogenesis GTPase